MGPSKSELPTKTSVFWFGVASKEPESRVADECAKLLLPIS